jgi:methyl-accepting chemotaxis protein
MGGGNIVMMWEIDAPIRVLGRHWGGFRAGYAI